MLKMMTLVTVNCPFCGKEATIEVPTDGYILWQSGELIQNAFPSLSADVREQLISGICPTCWNGMFSDEEEEDFEDYDDCDYEVGYDPYMGCFTDDC